MDINTRASRQKQTTLTFSGGQLSTKGPLINPQAKDDPSRKDLAAIAREMKAILPGILLTRPDAQPYGYLYDSSNTPKLSQKTCPGLQQTKIRVVNSDTIDAALSLPKSSTSSLPVCILNMANARSAGGGWTHGALAQEEALCYRTSLYRTLKLKFYPLPEAGGIYSSRVLVIRESMKNGHALVDLREPKLLPILSVVSVAAICLPQTSIDAAGRTRYSNGQDARMMEEKIRVILRMAALNGHRQLVLGAFGCGAFGNPNEEVAKMWQAVFAEPEFTGGWWEDVIFAVLDDGGARGNGNFQVFHQRLDGLMV